MSVLGLGFPTVITPSRPASGYGDPNVNGLSGLLGQEYTNLNTGKVFMKGDPSRSALGWFPIGSATGNATVLYGSATQISPLGIVVQSGPAVWYGTAGQIWIKTDPGNDFLNWFPLTTVPIPTVIDPAAILPPLVIGGIDYGSQAFSIAVNQNANSQGQTVTWTFPPKWVDGVTLVPGGAPNGGTTHWPVFSLTLQRSPSSTNFPTPFHLFNSIQATPPPTAPDWVNIFQVLNTSVDLLPTSFSDPLLPTPVWNYRLSMNIGPFGIGPGGSAEIDWPVATIGQSVTSGTLRYLATSSPISPAAQASSVRGCVVDSQNRTTIVGIFSGTISIQGQSITTQFPSSAFLARFNSDGTLQLFKRLTATDVGSLGAYGVALDSSGNIAICGLVSQPCDFGNGVTLTPVKATDGSYYGDVFVAMFDVNGNAKWAKNFAPASPRPTFTPCVAYAIAHASNDDFVVGGYIVGNVNFGSINLNTSNLSSSGFLFRITNNGQTVSWATQIGTGINGPTRAYSLGLDASDNVWAGGLCTADTNPGDGPLNTNTWLAKYNGTTGLYVTGSQHGINGSFENLGVTVDKTNGLAYFTGNTSSSQDFGNGQTVPSPGGAFLAQYSNSTGLCNWVRSFGAPGGQTSGADKGQAVAVDSQGRVFITGLMFDPGTFNGVAGTRGDFIASFDSLGNFRWSVAWTGSGAYSALGPQAIAIDKSGGVSSCGLFNQGVTFGTTSNGTPLTGSAPGNVFQIFCTNYTL